MCSEGFLAQFVSIGGGGGLRLQQLSVDKADFWLEEG
jgi:hypothetical protein